jgi:hypothetical protein
MMKAITGIDYLFEWNAPAPVIGTPTITFKVSSDVTLNMTHSRVNISVTAIGNDRRTLTIASSVSLESDQVSAFLKTDGDTFYNVKIIRIVGTSAILADPLPREIDLSTPANLEFALWYVTASAANVTSTSGTYQYLISYVEDRGQNNLSKLDKGIIKVTPRPFDTGLNHDMFVNQFANFADMIPRRQSDFKPQIKASLNELALMLREELSASNVTEDEIFNPESFRLCHIYCTAARIYEMNLQFDSAEIMRNRCIELMKLALSSIDLDLDGDGIIDDGEIDLSKSGGSASDFRASFASRTITDYEKTFKPARGMRH